MSHVTTGDDGERWERFVGRVRAVAREHGGHSYVDEGRVQLNPPAGGGEIVTLSVVEEDIVRLETGFVTSLLSRWDEPDQQDGVLPLIEALMAGRIFEIADVAADGRWFQIRTQVRRPDGSVQRESRRPASAEIADPPVAASHERRLTAWSLPGPTTTPLFTGGGNL